MDITQLIKNINLANAINASNKDENSDHLVLPDISFKSNPILDMANENLSNGWSVDSKIAKKYEKYGLDYNPSDYNSGSLDRQLAEAQSGVEKIWHGLAQGVVSEILLGVPEGFAAIADAIGQIITDPEGDYSTEFSRKIEKVKTHFNEEVAPIHVNPDIQFGHGALFDAGYVASMIPSIFTTVSLLVPGLGYAKGVSMLGKGYRFAKTAAKVHKAGKSMNDYIRTGGKWAARAKKIKSIDDAEKAYAGLTSTLNSARRTAHIENISNALFQRTAENYQEAHQVYDDMYQQAVESFNRMNDEEFQAFCERNSDTLEGVNTSSKTAVAKAIAKQSADRTFREDYVNIIFDIAQVYALRNFPFKGMRNRPTSRKVYKEHQLSKKYPGKTREEIKEILSKRSKVKNAVDELGYFAYGSGRIIGTELSEGVEEMVNYVAQQEGLNYGHVLLGEEKDSLFGERLSNYLKSPALYESGFWGVLGGVAFQGVGSGVNLARNKIGKKIHDALNKEDEITKEKVQESTENDSWSEWWETPELKSRLADVRDRGKDFNDYMQKMDMIFNQGRNPYKLDENKQPEAVADSEKEILAEKAYNDMLTKMALRAMDNGNFDLLKEYLSSDAIRDVLVEKGVVSKEKATQYQQTAIAKLEHIENLYDENLKTLDALSSKINAENFEPIPLPYLQIIARENINSQLAVEDLERQLEAWTIDSEKLKQQFRDKLDPNVDYKSAIRLVYLTHALGELEAAKKVIVNDKKRFGTIRGQEEIKQYDTRIEKVKQLILDLEENTLTDKGELQINNKMANLLFAMQNAMSFEKFGNNTRQNTQSKEYLDLRRLIVDAEKDDSGKAIQQLDEYISKLDPRLKGITKAELNKANLITDNIRIAEDEEIGLDKISTRLHDAFFNIADLQTYIAFTKLNINETEDEVVNRVNQLHNQMNAARQEALSTATQRMFDLADKYGSDKVLEALYDRYNSKYRNDYFGDTAENIADGNTFNDIADIFHFTTDTNKGLFTDVESILKQYDDIKAAQEKKSSTSENAISTDENAGTILSQADTQALNSGQKSGVTDSETQKQTLISQIEQADKEAQQADEIALEDNGVVYGKLVPTNDGQNTYQLILDENQPKSVEYLNNPDFYNKNGIALTDEHLIVEYPIVTRKDNGELEVVKEGLLGKPTQYNQNKVAELNRDSNKEQPQEQRGEVTLNGKPLGSNIPIIENSSTGEVVLLNADEPAVQNYEEPSIHTTLTSQDERDTKIIDDVLSEGKRSPTMSDEEWDVVKNKLEEKYITPLKVQDDIDNTQSTIDKYIARAKKKSQKHREKANTVDEQTKSDVVLDAVVKASRLRENPNSFTIQTAFDNAVEKLVEQYKDDISFDVINGKNYVSLSALLRYCNNVVNEDTGETEHYTAGNALYEQILKYLRQHSDQYVLVDRNVDEALEIARLTKKQLIEKLNTKQTLFGINLNGVIEEINNAVKNGEITQAQADVELNAIYDVIDNLQIGDKIEYELQHTDPNDDTTPVEGIWFKKGNTVIGKLPIPKTNNDGSSYQNNDTWVTDVKIDTNGNLSSKLKDLFKKWLINETNSADIKEINDLALKVAFDKTLTPDDIIKINSKLLNNPEIQQAIKDGYINTKAKGSTVVGLSKLWAYAGSLVGVSSKETTELKLAAIDSWFNEEVAPSFRLIYTLMSAGNGSVVVGDVSEGELIITDQKDKLPISEAIANKYKNAIRLAVARTQGEIRLAGKGIDGTTILNYGYSGKSITPGGTVIVIPARNGQHGYVHAFPRTIEEMPKRGKIKQLYTDILAKFEEIKSLPNTKDAYNELEGFVKQLINSPGGKFNGGITPLFRLVGTNQGIKEDINKTTNSKVGFTINYIENGVRKFVTVWYRYGAKSNDINTGIYSRGLRIFTSDGRNSGIIVGRNNDGSFILEQPANIPSQYNTGNAVDIIRDIILRNAVFNIAYDYVDSDNTNYLQNAGFAFRGEDGSFNINIPLRNREPKPIRFDSFNDFIVNNDCVTCTTKTTPDGKSNFNRQSATGNVLANQRLRITTELVSPTPVERELTKDEVKSTNEQIREVLDNNEHPESVARRITEIILGDKIKMFEKNAKIFDLLPKRLIFADYYLGFNAEVNIGKTNVKHEAKKEQDDTETTIVTSKPGETLIGKEWLNLANGNMANKREAVRKLIHERLHHILHTDDNEKYVEQIRSIFDEFVKKNKNKDLEQYYFLDEYEEDVKDKNGEVIHKKGAKIYYDNNVLNAEGLEEFLVESLTASDLINALNSITVEEKYKDKVKHESLFQKIMKFLAELFGWDIKKGSLYEKEFRLLGEALSVPIQTELNFDESDKNNELENNKTPLEKKESIDFDKPLDKQDRDDESELESIKEEGEMSADDPFGLFDIRLSTRLETSIDDVKDDNKIETHIPSPEGFVERFKLDDQIKLLDKIEDSEISIRCKQF